MATFLYQYTIKEFQQKGIDFTRHLYIPKGGPTTGEERHDCGNHHHIYKRQAQHVGNGRNTMLNYEAFEDVLKDPDSGLTHTALTGKQKQSLKDAERLLSYLMVHSLERHGHAREAEYVEVLVKGHEATDGCALPQLTRSKYNYQMLALILDR